MGNCEDFKIFEDFAIQSKKPLYSPFEESSTPQKETTMKRIDRYWVLTTENKIEIWEQAYHDGEPGLVYHVDGNTQAWKDYEATEEDENEINVGPHDTLLGVARYYDCEPSPVQIRKDEKGYLYW